MKSLLLYCALVLCFAEPYAQTDTLVINFSVNGSPPIFGKTNWNTPKHYTTRDRINPNYDTIFWKKDSSLYTGYMKMLSSEMHYTDTSHTTTSCYKVDNGIVSFIRYKTLSYTDENNNRTQPWLVNQGYSTDSCIVHNKFYYNGQLSTESVYFPDLKIRISKIYDTTGTLTYITQKKNDIQDGENFIRLSNCCGLTIICAEGKIKSFEAPSLLLFNTGGKRINVAEFVTLLNLDSSYSWGHLVVEADSQTERHLLLYLVKNHKGQHYSTPGRGLNLRRKNRLLKKASQVS